MKLAVEMGNMDELPLTPTEIIDWMRFANSDEEMEKFTRLIVALQYVQSPQDRNIVTNLKENIKINNSKIKK